MRDSKNQNYIVLTDAMYRNIKTGQSRKSLDAVAILNFKTIEIE